MLHSARRVASWPSVHKDAARKSSISFQKKEKRNVAPFPKLLAFQVWRIACVPRIWASLERSFRRYLFHGEVKKNLFLAQPGLVLLWIFRVPPGRWARCLAQRIPIFVEQMNAFKLERKYHFFQEGFGTGENEWFSHFTFNRLESWPWEARKIIKIS